MGAAGPWPWASAGGWEAQAAGLLLSLSFSNSLFKAEKIKRKKKGRKERLEKELGTGIISTDS